jgi:hypothetical protein
VQSYLSFRWHTTRTVLLTVVALLQLHALYLRLSLFFTSTWGTLMGSRFVSDYAHFQCAG